MTGNSGEQQIDYDDCVTTTASGHRVVRRGRVRVLVERAGYCSDGRIAPSDVVTLSLEGFAETETAGAETWLSLTATLTSTRRGRGRQACAGDDAGEQLNGTLQLSCKPGAESWPCPDAGVDVALRADALQIERRSGGFPCEREATLSGRLAVQDRSSGETYTQSFDTLRIAERTLAGNVRSLDLVGRVSSDCVGPVDLVTQQPLLLPPKSDCPVGGAITLGQPDDEPMPVAAALLAFARAAPPRGDLDTPGAAPAGAAPGDGELRQRLFRAANGQLYQVVQNTGAGASLGAEAVRITTVVGSLEAVSECATAADARANPQAVVAAARAVPLAAAVKSGLIGSTADPCFNRNADDGAGRVCVGSGCTADCQCPQGAACTSFSQSTGIGLSRAGAIPAAEMVPALTSPSPPCSGFGALATYRFGSTGPTTEIAQCAPAPADGFDLRAGQTIVFAYAVPPLALVQAGIGGFLVDEDGADAIGCGPLGNEVLNSGEVEKQSVAGPQVTFTESGAEFDYDPGPAGVGSPPDAVLAACAAAVRLTCNDMATPTPTATPTPGGASRPCAAIALASNDSLTQSGSTAGSLDHASGADCGWTKGGKGWPDVVYEYVPPADGTYDIAVRGVDFDPLLYVRTDSCVSPVQLACNDDGAEPGNADATLAVDLVRGQRIAVVVDGEDARGGPFSLQLRRRRPDLVIRRLIAPAEGDAGADVVVSAEIRNDGDAPAGPFRAEFFFARGADLTAVLGRTPVVCTVAALAPGATAVCAPTAALAVPLVAAGDYVLAVRVDPDSAVDESREDNNVAAQPVAVHVVGTELQQLLLRAADGTAYQLLRAVPRVAATAAERFQITAVAGSGASLRACAATTAAPGAPAFAAVAGIDAFASVRHSGVLLPSDVGEVGFDPAGSGRLLLGTGTSAVGVCKSAGDCAGIPSAALLPLGAANGGVPPACLALQSAEVVEIPPQCSADDVSAFAAFALTAAGDPPTCTEPFNATVATTVCRLSPIDGFALRPGEAAVFVYAPGLEPFSTGVAAFGVDENEDNPPGCTREQVVEALALRADTAKPPILTFIERYKKDSLVFQAAALSGDGRNLYAGSDKSLFVFGRGGDAAEFSLVEVERDGINGVTGLAFLSSISVSADDRYVYVVGGDPFFGDDSLLVFRRNPEDGGLQLVQILRRGIGLGAELFNGVSTSSNGGFVYVAKTGGLEVLARDDVSGRLRLLQEEDNPETFVTAGHPQVSPDGAQIYLPAFNCIAVFDQDPLTGRVSAHPAPDPCVGGTSIALTRDGKHMYAATDDGLRVLARDAESGTLTPIDLVSVTSPELSTVRAVTVSENGERVALLITGEAGAEVRTYRRNAATGTLMLIDAHTGPELVEPVAIAASADGRSLFVANRGDFDLSAGERSAGSIAVLDELDNRLRPRQALPGPGLPFAGLGGASALASDSLGGNLYVTGADDDALSVFARDADTGKLSLLESYRDGVAGVDGLAGAAGVAVSPDGHHVYVAGVEDSALALFERRPDGTLRYASAYRGSDSGVQGLTGPAGVVVSADGANVYAADDPLLNFRRRAADGTLELSQTLASTEFGGDTTLSYPTAVALSPDQRHLYALYLYAVKNFSYSPSIAIASRDPQTGMLQPSGIVALASPFSMGTSQPTRGSLAVSADGGNVYVAFSGAFNGGGVDSFARDAATGNLELTGTISDSFLTGASASSVAVSPGGAYVFFGRALEGGFLVSATADLQILETQRNQEGRVDGLRGASAVLVSPDGRNVYVTGAGDAAVAAFKINRPDTAAAGAVPP